MIILFLTLKSFRNHPGHRTLFSPTSFISNFLPKVKGITLGSDHIFSNKHERQFFLFARIIWLLTIYITQLLQPLVGIFILQ